MHSSSSPAAALDAVAPGHTLRVTSPEGESALLCNVAGRVYAIEDRCSHDGGELDQSELDGCRIECPRHGAYFDVTSGAALTLPAILPLRTYTVRVEGNDIYIE